MALRGIASDLAYLSESEYNGGNGGGIGMVARVSSKGQITLSAAVRRKLGIAPNSQVEVIVKDEEIAIRPLKRVSELAGILNRYARPDEPEDWETIRQQTEKAVAEEVVVRNARRVRGGR
jgi:AbrB family looped-hinge helix DNA binding protein